MINVLICDDHALVRTGFRHLLSEMPDLAIAAEARDGASAIRCIRRGGIDMVLLDIALPGSDGLDVLTALQHECPKLPILAISVYPEQRYALPCLRRGAAGYLCKSADPQELIDAIRKIARGGHPRLARSS